jgi:hypothetical protein
MLRQLPVIQNPAGAHEIVLSPMKALPYIADVMRKMTASLTQAAAGKTKCSPRGCGCW